MNQGFKAEKELGVNKDFLEHFFFHSQVPFCFESTQKQKTNKQIKIMTSSTVIFRGVMKHIQTSQDDNIDDFNKVEKLKVGIIT